MPTAIRLPRVGQSMTEAEIVAWQVEPGQEVRAGDVVLTIETDKAEYEVEAPVAGILAPYAVQAGETAAVGTLLGWVLAQGEGAPDPVAPNACETGGSATPRGTAPESAPAPAGRVRASPKARRLAAQRGLDLRAVAGSGPEGLVTTEDVERAAGSSAPAAEATWRGRRVAERRRLSAVQLAGARRTAEAWSRAPHFVQMLDADMTRVREVRRGWKDAGGEGEQVGYNDFVVAALARGLRELPDLNAALDGDELVRFAEVNVGIAVDSPRGLVVPVIRRADELSLPELSRASRGLADKARRGALSPGDAEAGSATVSNLGAYGIRAGTPVLNAPESVLVFVGSVEDRVVARDGAIEVRPMCTLSVAYDHRVADGATAARLSGRVRDLLAEPAPLLG